MMHRRRYTVRKVESPDLLAALLTEHTWCGCNGFEHEGFLYLNDATSADGAQEYGVVHICEDRRDETGSGAVTGTQVESVTFSWCTKEEAVKIVRDIVGGWWGCDLPVEVVIEGDRHVCRLCA